MKYYFIAFSLLMSASVMAVDPDKDQDASHHPITIKMEKQEAPTSSDEESDRYYSSGGGSCEEGVEYLEPVSVHRGSVVIPTGLSPEEKYKAIIAAAQKANPNFHFPVAKED